MTTKPHIVLIVPRGEAVRNFIYSDTLRLLSQQARVTLLSVVTNERILRYARPYVERIIPLEEHTERRLVRYLRHVIHYAHFRWLWSKVAQNIWEWHDAEATTLPRKAKRLVWKAVIRLLANRPALRMLSALEREATWFLRPDDHFVRLFRELQPDLVFNTSHIHGPAGELPAKIAHHMGIPVAGFIFSWDNLTSRSRIFVPYDYYFVWHTGMRDQLLHIYPEIPAERVFITGTPQFDFHFKPEFQLSREELAQRIGFDPSRPYILYTTGIAHHFPEEHRTVELVIRLLDGIPVTPKPQLVVRTYIKDTSPEMLALAQRKLPDVFFPPPLWDKEWFTPLYEDLAIYTSLLRHAALGINAASTVSLELLMHDKPVINLGFDPPGSSVPHHFRYVRHIEFDHYWPVATSGAVMVARSAEDLREMLIHGLTQPECGSERRRQFISAMFGDTLGAEAACRVAERLIQLAVNSHHERLISV